MKLFNLTLERAFIFDELTDDKLKEKFGKEFEGLTKAEIEAHLLSGEDQDH